MTYDLTRLGNNRFEHLVQALSLAHLGPGVSIFGTGPDGGREATFNGEVDMGGKGRWNGYGVIQAKYKEKLTTTEEDQKWFLAQLTDELRKWIDPKKNRAENKPDYFIIATNVVVTPVAETGGLDRVRDIFAHFRDLTDDSGKRARKIGMPDFKDYAVWHAEQLERLLDGSTEVRHRYADLVLPGDVISRLYEHVTETDKRLAQAWIGHVTGALQRDTRVELSESGDDANSPLPLADVAVDLPSSFSPGHQQQSLALRSLVTRGDQVMAPGLKPAVRDRIVVLGGPGAGKSTLSRLLCQLYRVALVREAARGNITQQVAEQARHIQESFELVGLPTPTLHRLPVRVVLSAFADEVSKPRHLTLLQHIVNLINHRSSDPITIPEAKRLLSAWPLLVVLDGMDEVASADIREEVSDQISNFLNEMAALGADVFTVCTSRPIGFEQDPAINYEELHLVPLDRDHAMSYAARLLKSRFADDPERQDQTLDRLRAASHGADTARLMTSPLQVTILSILLEQRRQAPASRYALFKSYYDVIYSRECNKPEGIGNVLERYRSQFDQLHKESGLEVHVNAERAGSAESILTVGHLEQIARKILTSDGYRDTELNALVRQILHLAQQRLVLLVPRQNGVAFEVRSIAEFFAAQRLMEDEHAADKLELLIPSTHWRHTWLLSAGYIFAERRNLRDAVLRRLDVVDRASEVNRLVMPGAVLALDALLDGFAANTPRFEQFLLMEAMRLVEGPIGTHITRLAEALVPLMERSAELNDTVWSEIKVMLADNRPAVRTFLTGLAASSSDAIAHKATTTLTTRPNEPNPTIATPAADHSSILAAFIEAGLADSDQAARELLDAVCDRSTVGSESDNLLVRGREVLVDACPNPGQERSRLRESLAMVIRHDRVGHNLLSDEAVDDAPR
ncbi:hypothetical protein A5780_06450 [Nocardia sp. 852002-20019_SCH5090214]|uniref:NACHT domain-containing protein n=1 Tax=Nocardia sp. 852002-20019_SCH5090214 TaxID=1834087 RepID=UPI0007EB90F2|nr:AAA family ATPase [Nocardia sp. 852002-20019_SCH5090214]OBA41670.1 hypothetical protein A5780_06450 [Nocardia sp. 852002-20019_SCH5090214]